MQWLLRRATVADAETLSALSARTFTETFGHQYRPQDLAVFLAGAYAVQRQREILASADHACWLLEAGGAAVGYLVAGPCDLPHPQATRADGEIKRLYLLREWQSGGHGARMMQAAMDWLLRDGPRPLWVGVWSGNEGAQRFYARWGFQKAGEYLFEVGEARDLEFVLRRTPSDEGADA